jgi:hypothetical protein
VADGVGTDRVDNAAGEEEQRRVIVALGREGVCGECKQEFPLVQMQFSYDSETRYSRLVCCRCAAVIFAGMRQHG